MKNVIVLAHVYDQADLLLPFVAWYSQIGATRIIIYDMGSTDGSQEILDVLSQKYPLEWSSLLQDDLRTYEGGNTSNVIAAKARDRFGPSWLIMCDADEFLSIEGRTLLDVLEEAPKKNVTALTVPCHNMTGLLPTNGQASVTSLTTRIVKPYHETYEDQINHKVPVPFIFVKHMPKTIVWSESLVQYAPGTHGVEVDRGAVETIDRAHFKHYPFRSLAAFRQKVRNAYEFLKTNDHLEKWWAWHWRMWIEIDANGTLGSEFKDQFVSHDRQRQLLSTGDCVIDESISSWTLRHLDDYSDFYRQYPLGHDEISGLNVRLNTLASENICLAEQDKNKTLLIESLQSENLSLKARIDASLKILNRIHD